jgi:hypothetical protein
LLGQNQTHIRNIRANPQKTNKAAPKGRFRMYSGQSFAACSKIERTTPRAVAAELTAAAVVAEATAVSQKLTGQWGWALATFPHWHIPV